MFYGVPPLCICLMLFSSCGGDGVWGEEHRGQVPFPSRCTNALYCRRVRSLLRSTLLTWLWFSLSRCPPCPDHPDRTLGRMSPYTPHTYGGVLPLT